MLGTSVRGSMRLMGVFGLFFIATGLIFTKPLVGKTIRVFWLLVVAFRGPVVVALTVYDGRVHGRRDSLLLVYNRILTVFGLALFCYFLTQLSTVVQQIVVRLQRRENADRGDGGDGGDRGAALRLLDDAVCRAGSRMGNWMSLLLAIVVLPTTIVFGLLREFSEYDIRTTTLPVASTAYNTFEAFTAFFLTFILVFGTYVCNLLVRIDMTVAGGRNSVARARRAIILTFLALLVALPLSIVGLVFFLLGSNAKGDAYRLSLVLTNALLAIVFAIATSIDLLHTVELAVRAHAQVRADDADEAPLSLDNPVTARAVAMLEQGKLPWVREPLLRWDSVRRRVLSVAEMHPFGGEKGNRTLTVLLRALRVTFLTVAVVLAWFVPWILVSGPPDILASGAFWFEHAKLFAGGPAIIFSAIVFSFFFSFTVPVSTSAAASYSEWPRHTLTFGIPFYLAMLVTQMQKGRTENAHQIVTGVTLTLLIIEVLSMRAWMRRMRPTWTFFTPITILVLLYTAAMFVILFVAVPLFVRKDATDTDKVIVRISTEIGAFLFSICQVPLARSLSTSTSAMKRHYLPLALAAPLTIVGRFMVSGVDSLVTQALTVVILGLFEIAAVVSAPFVDFVYFKFADRTASTEQILALTFRDASSPVLASLTIVQIAIEYVGVILASVAVFVHGVAWYEDIDVGRLFIRLAASAAIQIAVEIVVDLVVLRVRIRRQDLDFRHAFVGGLNWIALILGLVASATLTVPAVAVTMLCREAVRIFQLG